MKLSSLCHLIVVVIVTACASAFGQLQRVPNTSLTNMPASLPVFGYTFSNAFPGLNFTNPDCIVSPPGETNRLFVVGKNGVIYEITNLAAPTETIFMNISSRVTSTSANSGDDGEQGLLSLAFDPGYMTNNYFYVFYTGQATNGNSGGTLSLHHFLSRFRFMAGDTNLGDPNSEVPIYVQLKRWSNHNGGDIMFGLDGYLYVSVGDEGEEHDYYTNAQHITWRLWSGILRLDVDKIDPLGLSPNMNSDLSQIYSKTTNYDIPHDNPFVNATTYDDQSIDANNVQTEFWATGLRNPWRMSFDPATSNLFCGDVGQDKIEEADVITKGGNYGWSWWEATNSPPSGVSSAILNATPTPINPTPPFVCYPHNGLSEAIIGGVVYRGSNLPQLYGYYVFADYVQGYVWAIPASQAVSLTQTNGTITPPTPIFNAGGSSVSAFGTDPRNGDVLYTSMSDSSIKRIIYNSTTTGSPPPATLYDTGAFTNLLSLTSAQDSLQPSPGILPYTINVPFWSDNALKSRWFSVPNTNLTIDFNASGNWNFPTGMVWIKNFNLELTNGDPTSQIRLETRLLMKNSSGIYGVTYIWNSQTNAVLAPAGGMDTNFVINDGGIIRTQTWHFPSQQECQTCHTTAGGFGLGFRTEQLNDTLDYGFGLTNEIQALSTAGYFTSPVTNDPSTLLALAASTNTAYSVEFRTRSFLQANCAQCHQPGGTAQQSLWDARITTPTALADLINGTLVNNLGNANAHVITPMSLTNSILFTRDATRDLGANPSIQMPPLDSYLTDSDATNLMATWILSMTNQFWIGTSPDPQTVLPGNNAVYTITFIATPDFTSSATLSVSGLPVGANANFSPATVSNAATNSTLTITTSESTPVSTYLLTVTGIGNGVTNTDTMTLNVSTVIAAAPGQLWWTDASGTDTNWSTSLNWTNIVNGGYGPPGVSNDLVFNNTAAGLTNFVDSSTPINSLWYRLIPSSGGTIKQFTTIEPGVTLNISGTNIITGSSFVTAGYSFLVGTNNSNGNGNGSSISAIISGSGGTLNINRPDGIMAVAQFNSSGNHPASASTRAILDLSGLDNFSASISQLLIGCMANGSAGTIYFAKTNTMTIANGSATSTAGFDIGDNGSNPGDPSYAYLGLNNQINANVIRVGGQKGYWGTLAFNPVFNGQNPNAVFRGTGGGSSRVSNWLIGDLIGTTGTANVTCPRGTNDFSNGSVDILADSLILGKTGTGNESALNVGTSSNRVAVGTLTLNAGTINVNNLTNGWQLASDLTDTGIGQINVNGGVLTVNSKLVLAAGVPNSYVGGNPDTTKNNIVTNLYYGAAFYATNAFAQGTLNVNGGTIFANSIIAGGGISTVSLNNGTLVLTNSTGTPASRVVNFMANNSTLRLNLNGNSVSTNICVTNLVASGVSIISIDAVANVTSAKTFPLISYNSFSGSVAANFAKGSLPNGFVASLVDNSAQHRIDLSVAASTNATPHFGAMNASGNNFIFTGSNGLPNGVYYVLASTNVALPLNLWTPISTNPFDANGNFNFTNGMSTNAQLFYLLQLP